MRLTEIVVTRKPVREDRPERPTSEDVPAAIMERFMRGLDDVAHGRFVSIDSALSEGRRRIAQHRTNNKNNVPIRLAQV